MSNDNNNNRKKKPKSQDEKQKRALTVERKKQGIQFNEFLLMAKRSQDFWLSPFCADLRSFSSYLMANTQRFPLNANDSPETNMQDRASTVSAIPELSSSFIDKLISLGRDDDKGGDNDESNEDDPEPVVRVLSCKIEYEGSGYKKDHQKVKRSRLVVADGSGKLCLAVAASQLMQHVKAQLMQGQPIIRLKVFTGTVYRDKDDEREKPGIIIVQYQFLCRPAVDVDLSTFDVAYCESYNEEGDDAEESVNGANAVAVSVLTNAMQPTTALHHRIVAFQKRDDVRKLPADSLLFCSRANRLCSKYGQKYHFCLAEKYESRIRSEDFLESISEQCYFVDREVKDMSMSHKRNVLYYWFATNHYFVRGAGARKELPECLLCLVRMTYPNDCNTPYTEFIAAPNVPQQRKRKKK